MSGGQRDCGEGSLKAFLKSFIAGRRSLLSWEIWMLALDQCLINRMTLGQSVESLHHGVQQGGKFLFSGSVTERLCVETRATFA